MCSVCVRARVRACACFCVQDKEKENAPGRYKESQSRYERHTWEYDSEYDEESPDAPRRAARQ